MSSVQLNTGVPAGNEESFNAAIPSKSNFYTRAWNSHPATMGLMHGALIGSAAVCAFYNREAIKDVALSSLDSTVKFLAPKVNSAIVSSQRGLNIVQSRVESAVNVSTPYIASAGNLVKIHAQAIAGYAHDGAKGIVKGVICAHEKLDSGLSYVGSKAAEGVAIARPKISEFAAVAGSKILEGAAIAKSSTISVIEGLKEQTPIVTAKALNGAKHYATVALPFAKPASAGLAGVTAIGTAFKKVYNFVRDANDTKKELVSLRSDLAAMQTELLRLSSFTL